MVPHQHVIWAAQSPWRWLVHCWRLRLVAAEVALAFSKSPTHVQVQQLETDKAELEGRLAGMEKTFKEWEESNARSQQAHRNEVQSLKAKYDKRIHATETDQVEALKQEIMQERDAKHLLKVELTSIQNKLAEIDKAHLLARQGNAALVRFIHTRHRLSVPFDPQSIRGILQKADQ